MAELPSSYGWVIFQSIYKLCVYNFFLVLVDYVSGLLTLFHDPCLFECQYHAILIKIVLCWYHLNLGSAMSPALFFSLKIVLAFGSLLWFHANFKIFFCFCKKCYWNFDRNFIESIGTSGSVDILTIFILCPWARYVFTFITVSFGFFHQCHICLCTDISPPWLYLFLSILLFWCYFKWGCFIYFSDNSLLVCRNVMGFCRLIFFVQNFPCNYLLISTVCTVNSLRFFCILRSCHLQKEITLLLSLWFGCLLLIFHA